MAVLIHEYRAGDKVMRLLPPYPFGVIETRGRDREGEMRPVVRWADGSLTSERRDKIVLDQCPLPEHVDAQIVAHFAKLAATMIRPADRDHSPFEADELVQHRFDRRSGVAMRIAQPVYSERGDRLTVVRWDNGPTRYELIENWKLISFLDWLDEAAITDDLDHGREPDRTHRATEVLRGGA